MFSFRLSQNNYYLKYSSNFFSVFNSSFLFYIYLSLSCRCLQALLVLDFLEGFLLICFFCSLDDFLLFFEIFLFFFWVELIFFAFAQCIGFFFIVSHYLLKTIY